jgi:hypothetical protein
MAEQYAQKLIYSYDFKSQEIRPMVETEILLARDDVLASFREKSLDEPLRKETPVQSEDVSLAEVQDDVAAMTETSYSSTQTPTETEQGESRHYAITYFNPATGKSEVLSLVSSIRIKDYAKSVVDESVGLRSTYPIYSFIASPLVQTVIDPYKLQEIKDNMEYGTPPKFGGAMAVRCETKPVVKIVPLSRKEVQKNMFGEAMMRKQLTRNRVEEEIILLEKAVQDLKAHMGAEEAIKRLPALSRARFQAALRKKHLSPIVVLGLMEKDVSFLKNVKKKLDAMSRNDLLDLARAMWKLKS